MKDIQGETVLKFASDNKPTLPIIVLTAQSEIRIAVECIRLGAYDFITKPYNFDELLITINRAVEHKNLLVKTYALSSQIVKHTSGKIIGNSKELQRVITLAGKSAHSDSNVLIEGETGTGKELFAEYIHSKSGRRDKPFVVINCASLPDQLIESELFGHEKGAFTDAKTTKQGLVEIAHGGTLFLDEIGELSLTLQPKLLRFLENGEYRRIGGVTNYTSNVRVIGATNRNLLDETDKKKFRKDLLFRLNVITITIPPLRDRRDDILVLAEYFIEKKTPVRSHKKLSEEAVEALLKYNYPGNVRELEHIIERSLIFSEGEIIYPEDLNLPRSQVSKTPVFELPDMVNDETGTLDEIEKNHIEKVLTQNKWNRNLTAQQLDVSLKTLYTKIKKYQLKKND
jgi:two-component system, NtrC family, response regulator AtoC